MGQRRRILLAVQPRVLGDALAAVLEGVGLDDVLLSAPLPADRSSMSFDAAILSEPDSAVHADVVIQMAVLGDDRLGSVTAGSRTESVPLESLQELLSVLDRFCPSTAARVAPAMGTSR